jgi:hypothetical protein
MTSSVQGMATEEFPLPFGITSVPGKDLNWSHLCWMSRALVGSPKPNGWSNCSIWNTQRFEMTRKWAQNIERTKNKFY